ncbi:MAG TPA: cell division protein SepF [Paenibacillaceae bacterium]|nr:cell division protein SepF [Paenibacillaceae bacterium]
MGFVSKIKDFFSLGTDEYYEEIVEEEEIIEEEYIKPKKNKQVNTAGNVVNLHAVKDQGVRMILMEPRSYEEAQEIADHLRSRRGVVLNLQRVTQEQAKRIVDFLSGTVYALNGDIQKIGPGIFICVPEQFEMQGNISELLFEERGI